jgi:ribosomal protein L11 methyltransferase
VERDNERTAWLESQNFRVIRFWNSDVLSDLDGVIDMIRRGLVGSRFADTGSAEMVPDEVRGDPIDGWQVTVELPSAECVPAFEAALAWLDGTLSMFEIDSGPSWRVTVHCMEAPDRAEIAGRLAAAASSCGIAAPGVRIEAIAETDWVAEYRRRASPVSVGRFFVYPSHHEGGVPGGMIGLALDAGLAFGTGEHESTRGCLTAFERLAGWGAAPSRVLDMGCGSGILAIAAAKLWPGASVLGCDNDPVAVAVAAENVAANCVAARIRLCTGEGYAAQDVRAAAPFDLIAANILADPLEAMAGDLARHLAPAGHAVLSGLLAAQAEGVLGAHAAHGLALAQRIDLDDWTTLILARG